MTVVHAFTHRLRTLTAQPLRRWVALLFTALLLGSAHSMALADEMLTPEQAFQASASVKDQSLHAAVFSRRPRARRPPRNFWRRHPSYDDPKVQRPTAR